METRKVTVTATEVYYRTQTFEVDVPEDIDDEDVGDFISPNGFEINEQWEIDDDVPYETITPEEAGDLDTNRYDVYRDGKQVYGGH
jgi:predicted helicase